MKHFHRKLIRSALQMVRPTADDPLHHVPESKQIINRPSTAAGAWCHIYGLPTNSIFSFFFILMNTRETSRDRKMRNAHEISNLKAGDFSQVGHRYLDHSVPPNLQGPEAITSDVQGGTSLF